MSEINAVCEFWDPDSTGGTISNSSSTRVMKMTP